MHFLEAGLPLLTDVKADFRSGVHLIELLEIVSDDSIGKYHRNPKQLQALENLNVALEFMKHKSILLHNIGAMDIYEGNLTLTLGLLWKIILHYTINGISDEGRTAKEGLLVWCQRKTAGYDGVDIQNFHSSWKSGLALCALLDHYRPDLIDFGKLDHAKERENTETALRIAEEEVSIPRFIDVDDVCGCRDEKALIMYLANWFHAFSSLDNIETAGRRVEKFGNVCKSVKNMKIEYENRMSELSRGIVTMIERWDAAADLTDTEAVVTEFREFQKYKKETKRAWVTERTDLGALLGNIRVQLAAYSMPPYSPPKEVSTREINCLWIRLLRAESNQLIVAREQMRKVKDDLRITYAEKANSLGHKIRELVLEVSDMEGGVESQLEEISRISTLVKPLHAELADLSKVLEVCDEVGVTDNDLTVHTFDDLQYELNLVQQAVSSKLLLAETQLLAPKKEVVSPELVAEFESIFRHFDKLNRNALDAEEFTAALASLGVVYTDAELKKVLAKLMDDRDLVPFKMFIQHITSISADRPSLEQVRRSFLEITGGRKYVTRKDLENAMLSDESIAAVLEPMVETPEGYDFMQYLASLDGGGSGAQIGEQDSAGDAGVAAAQ